METFHLFVRTGDLATCLCTRYRDELMETYVSQQLETLKNGESLYSLQRRINGNIVSHQIPGTFTLGLCTRYRDELMETFGEVVEVVAEHSRLCTRYRDELMETG